MELLFDNLHIIVFLITLCYFIIKRYYYENIPLKDIKGKFVFVTGCDSGFGRLLVHELLKKNINVIAGLYTDIGQKNLINECSDKEIFLGNLYTVSLDVTNIESVQAAYKFVENLMIEKKTTLWSVVNNAGANIVKGPIEWYNVEDFKMHIDINLMGPIRVCQTFIPLLKKSKGRFVTMISCSGRIHGFFLGPYTTSKFGLRGYMDSLRLDLQPFGISVHVLEPGAFKTPLTEDKFLADRIEKAFNSLSDEAKDDYGSTFKNNLIVNWQKGVDIAASSNLYLVVDNYIHAITSTKPRHRYLCGYDAWLLFLPLSLLPSHIQDKILYFLYTCHPSLNLNFTVKKRDPVISEINNNEKKGV
ncbi:Short-chain dehydrogenase/reductase SDR family and Glucose/ribitol dehydrogenase family and NAD(P)-binding domain-containing protein [Strongyloides ratti]|uniref:Short-chain dehydrogenase/reductase SDR family and Glucose/ribitol dehydrogenase family and NAD(P)-binding domain-containing protein n=1 Tax=Strongyloides ratti TaxID=34506 RepID=A0A090L0S8_STRRB|nr:Short-chain dehydrogenase/reductase SDR family and Glucose/ribitol dehydrogenase family and NAD(P)-binding domain-containing protein [Strongyloides ratti]CEF63395.1 Short-chain dehydrogenase/reductase SDR family and Glucose/ribitol dehydrogenase family and NAD(P)-binding domain-containing protein [Strongyloides ratti]